MRRRTLGCTDERWGAPTNVGVHRRTLGCTDERWGAPTNVGVHRRTLGCADERWGAPTNVGARRRTSVERAPRFADLPAHRQKKEEIDRRFSEQRLPEHKQK